MRFPMIGLFWGIVWGSLGGYLALPIVFTLCMGVLFTISTLCVRDWYERVHGIRRYDDA